MDDLLVKVEIGFHNKSKAIAAASGGDVEICAVGAIEENSDWH